MNLFAELKRRNVFKVAAVYAIVGWLIMQAGDVMGPALHLPEWVNSTLAFFLILGFPLAMVFAWAFEMTPEGLRKEKDIDRGQSVAIASGRKLNYTITALLAVALVYFVWESRFQTGSEPVSQEPAAQIVNPDNEQRPEIPSTEDNGPDSNTIAVLPFTNMSSDPEQEYFSDGITEEILNLLVKIPELKVTSRTSVFSLKGQNVDIPTVAKKLGVAHILEGSIRKAGDRVRITAQLIEAENDVHLWSETYERKLENIFAIQDDIASQIAAALRIPLGITTKQPGHSEKLVSPEAYDLYLRARALHRQRGGRGLLEALELFQKALDIDPQFAPAWAGLAHTYIVIRGYVSKEELEQLGDLNAKSRVAAKKALELDPTLATALHAMANSQRRRLEWASAQEYYETALKHDPEAADVMEDYAYLLLNSIQLKASKRVVEHMLALDPYVATFYGVAIDLYNTLGDFDKRDNYIQTALDINPEHTGIQKWNYIRLLQYGELQKAHNYVDQVNQPGSARAESYHKMIDWMAAPEQPLDKAMQDAGVSSSLYAYVSGNYELYLTLRWRESDPPIFWAFSRVLAPMVTPEQTKQNLANPRTHELVQALRLPEYWRKVGWPDICRPIGEHDFECE